MSAPPKSTQRGHSAVLANSLRAAVAGAAAAVLVLGYRNIDGLGSAAIYVATWVTFLHICIGEYVFVRHLHANAPIQNALDMLAGLFLFGAILAATSPPLWCALFAGLFALAVTKYLLVARTSPHPELKQYAREKVRWESPAVVALVVTAVILDQLPAGSTVTHVIHLAILVATTAFAIWMIGVRHAYRQLASRPSA